MGNKAFRWVAKPVLRAMRYLFPEQYSTDVRAHSQDYQWALNRATTLGNQIGEVEKKLIETADALTTKTSAYGRLSEEQIGELARKDQRIERLEAGNAALEIAVQAHNNYIQERTGLVRQRAQLEREVSLLKRKVEETQKSEARTLTLTYCSKDYKHKPIVITNPNGEVIFQNRAMSTLLGAGERMVHVNLDKLINLKDRSPQVKLIGKQYFSFTSRSRGEGLGYEVQVKDASAFYKRSKAPHILNIPRFSLGELKTNPKTNPQTA